MTGFLRRRFLAGVLGVGTLPVALPQSRRNAEGAIDFARSFCYYVPRSTPIWVRIQVECRCRLVDTATGASDEYVLGVRTQTGLRTEPPSDLVDPGYDFWMIFSRRHIFIRRVHPSSYNDNSVRVPADTFVETGWRLQPSASAPLGGGTEIAAALRAWRVVVARTEIASRDGSRRLVLEYPVKWADGAPQGGFRVETGPILMLDPDRAQVGRPPDLGDFRWAYLDYRSFDQVRVLLERPTSIFTGSTLAATEFAPRRNPPLEADHVARIEKRLLEDWAPPIPAERLRRLLETDHHSEVARLAAKTRLFALTI